MRSSVDCQSFLSLIFCFLFLREPQAKSRQRIAFLVLGAFSSPGVRGWSCCHYIFECNMQVGIFSRNMLGRGSGGRVAAIVAGSWASPFAYLTNSRISIRFCFFPRSRSFRLTCHSLMGSLVMIDWAVVVVSDGRHSVFGSQSTQEQIFPPR